MVCASVYGGSGVCVWGVRVCMVVVVCVYGGMLDKKVSEYDQEIPQSQTADNPVAPRGRAAQPSRDTRKTNQAKQPALSSPSR